MLLKEFVALLETEPGCASTFPGLIGNGEGPSAPVRRDPLPFQTRILISAMMDAARLYQLANRVGGEIQGPLIDAANFLVMRAGAGQHKAAELYQMVLANWPPPPPSFTVRTVESLAMQYAVEVIVAGSPHVPTGRKLTVQQIIFDKLLHVIDGPGTTSGPHTNTIVPIHLGGPVPRFIGVTGITNTER